MVELLHLKIEIYKRGRTIKELLDELGFEYTKGIKFFNGYQNPPLDFEYKASKVISKWDEEKLGTKKAQSFTVSV